MRRIARLALGGVLLAGGALATEPTGLPPGDAAAGRKLAGMCRTCHGLDGFARIPIAPHIGGEQPGYIERQLMAFRAGARVHEMMSVVAKTLTDQQIANLAAWYGAHKAVATQVARAADAPEACIVCHGTDGLALVDDVPNLAGETNIYIDTQLKAFRGGKRTHEIMSVVAAEMSDAEIRAAADWYAAVKIRIEPPPP